jgi:hypothetical protein
MLDELLGRLRREFPGVEFNVSQYLPAASVPSSGRPCCDTTRSISGTSAMIRRMRLT